MLTSWEPCTQINSLSASVSGKSQRHSTIRRPVDIEKKPCEAQSMAILRCSHHIKATTHAENQLAGLSVSEEPASSQLVHSGADRFPVSPSLPEVSNSGGRGNQTRPQVSKKSQPHSTIRRPAQNEQQPRDALRTSSAVRKPASQEAQDAFLCPEACRSLHGVVKTTSASST